jgi:hypothetical protein
VVEALHLKRLGRDSPDPALAILEALATRQLDELLVVHIVRWRVASDPGLAGCRAVNPLWG